MFSTKSSNVIQFSLLLGLTGLFTASPLFACSTKSQATPRANLTQIASAPTLVDVAASNPEFSTLVAALKAADLVEVLSGTTELTVFAPTNAAFAALPEGTVETLLLPENKDQLIKILTYHVVPGRVTSSSLSAGAVQSVEGQPLTINLSNGVAVNNANVVQADVKASNGVIHVIDQVLLPSN